MQEKRPELPSADSPISKADKDMIDDLLQDSSTIPKVEVKPSPMSKVLEDAGSVLIGSEKLRLSIYNTLEENYPELFITNGLGEVRDSFNIDIKNTPRFLLDILSDPRIHALDLRSVPNSHHGAVRSLELEKKGFLKEGTTVRVLQGTLEEKESTKIVEQVVQEHCDIETATERSF